MFIDVGVGTYTRKTFSSERYSIWTMQSNYHNLPLINGFAQENGREYKASRAVFNEDESRFSVDIAGAYPTEAAINKWIRSYQVVSDKKFLIADDFSLQQAKTPNQVSFMTAREPILSGAGKIKIPLDNNNAILSYNPDRFEAAVEIIELKDPLLSRVWSGALYRLSLTAKQLKNKDKNTFTLEIY